MKNIDDVTRLPDESEDTYCQRLYLLKDTLHLTWMDLAEIINEEFGYSYSPDRYRKSFTKSLAAQYNNDEVCMCDDEGDDDLTALRMERVKLADERTQVNALYRRIAREDSIKEIAREAVQEISKSIPLKEYAPIKVNKAEKEAILQISDWHYGITIQNFWNKYDPEIAKERINKLKDETIRICKEEGITKLHVVNLGDLIAGRIHLQLRINSRFDVITQVITVSELLAQMLNEFSKYFNVDYRDTLDNHSRLEPDLKESLDLESLTRITTWYLKSRLTNVTIYDNIYSDDIITFDVLGHPVCAVHGDKDSQVKVIKNLSGLTQQHYDLVLTAHLHHMSANEENMTVLVSNSSLMGTDDYALKYRLSAKPSQNLIIATKENVMSCLYKINVD